MSKLEPSQVCQVPLAPHILLPLVHGVKTSFDIKNTVKAIFQRRVCSAGLPDRSWCSNQDEVHQGKESTYSLRQPDVSTLSPEQ